MTEALTIPLTPQAATGPLPRPTVKERAYAGAARALAVLLLPAAALRDPGNAHYRACQWALAARFPAERLDGLTEGARAAFTCARAEAFWADHQLIGLTSGHREEARQAELFAAEVLRTGSATATRLRVLPPNESAHVQGIALDVRPREGARWLERNGGRFDLYRRYDNEWWHIEHHPGRPPVRLPHPGAAEGVVRLSGSLY